MPYFTSLQNYIDSVTARFNKPKRSLLNDGIVKQDVIDALTDTAKYADDVKTAGEALNANFLQRSLNLAATIYVDGVNGDDARTGSTNDNNALTGRVKTLARVAALHSGKTFELQIVIAGNVIHNADVTIKVPIVSFNVIASFTYAKKVALQNNGVVYGDGTNGINWQCLEVNILNTGTLIVEAHSGSTGLGDQQSYAVNQGANRLLADQLFPNSSRLQVMNVSNSGPITVGANTVFAVPGVTGTSGYSWNFLSVYRRSGKLAGTFNLGANAIESLMQGDNLNTVRTYTPTSSTDQNLVDNEMTADQSYLYKKFGGVIKKIAWVNF